MRVSDPTCGSGGMLIESARHVADIEGKRLGQPVNVTLHGQEKNLGTWAIAKMNLLLHGLRDARIEKGDTIRNPRLLDNEGNLILYDRVIANPPFSLDAWGADDVWGDDGKRTSIASSTAFRPRTWATSPSFSTWSRRSTLAASAEWSCRTACCFVARAMGASARAC